MHIRKTLMVSLAPLLSVPGWGALPTAMVPAEPAQEVVAIVSWISGPAMLKRASGKNAVPLSLFDRLAPGVEIETGVEARLTLVFFDGQRFAMRGEARVRVRHADLEVETGSIERLKPVPALAKLPRLARTEKPGTKPGAGRIRHSEAWSSGARFALYPGGGAAVLKDAAVLLFTPVPGVERYHIEVTDALGRAVFVTDTRTTEIRVPGETLESGAIHYWGVSSGGRDHKVLHGSAFFVILGAEGALAHHELTSQARDSEEIGLQMLAAEVDRSLGLRREACEALARGADGRSQNPALQAALDRFGCTSQPWRTFFAAASQRSDLRLPSTVPQARP